MVSTAAAYDSAYADLAEWIPDCIFPQSMTTYSHMRHDTKLTAVMKALTLPIRRAPWSIDGAGCRQEVVELCSSALGVPIAGQDRPIPGGVKWADVLRLSTLSLTFGFMPFAKQYDVSTGQARLIRLQERMPITVTYIGVDDNGELDYIDQSRLLTSKQPVEIKAKDLFFLSHEREGAAWHGQSVLRPAYAPWLIKHEMMRVLATSSRRFGMGVPVVDAPQGAGDGMVSQAQQLASAARAGDQSGVGMPFGFKFHLEGLQGSVPDTLGFLKWLDESMAQMALAGWLDMPSTSHGSRALGETFMDLFMLSLQSEATWLSETFTTDLLGEVVALNYGDQEPVPTLVCGDVGSRQEVTAQALQLLLESGALSADPELEAWVRANWSLPPRDPNTPWQPPNPPASPPPFGASRLPFAAAATGGRSTLRRDPTLVELASSTDFVNLQDQWESALDKLVADWNRHIAPKALDLLLSSIADAVENGDQADLANLTADVPGAAALIKAHLVDLAENAADDAAEEAFEQGVDNVDAGVIDDSHLEAVAGAAAGLGLQSMASSAGKKALQVWSPTATAEDVTAAVQAFVESLSGAQIKDLMGGSLSTAQNAGRLATLQGATTLDGAPEPSYFASEILDAATCDPCVAIDGTQFDDLDAAAAAYANGGYVDCEGGLRCRGVIVTVWGDVPQTAEEAAALAYADAKGIEPELTSTLQDLADEHGGDLNYKLPDGREVLNARLKTEESIARKLTADMAAKGLTPAQAADGLFDVNRYTTVFPTESYIDGSKQTLAKLLDDGYSYNAKNFWLNEDNPYQGINVQVTTPGGNRFELQFHTPDSIEVKEGELHRIYELSRKETDEAKLEAYRQESFKAAAKIPVPADVHLVESGKFGPAYGG
jgi:hypothetical protein